MSNEYTKHRINIINDGIKIEVQNDSHNFIESILKSSPGVLHLTCNTIGISIVSILGRNAETMIQHTIKENKLTTVSRDLNGNFKDDSFSILIGVDEKMRTPLYRVLNGQKV